MEKTRKRTIAFLTCSTRPEITEDDGAAAAILREHGIEVVGLPWDETPPEKLARLDCVIIRSTWNYHKKGDQFAHWLSAARDIGIHLLNSCDVVLWNSRKSYLADLKEKGIPTLPTIRISRDTADPVSEIAKVPWKELVIKPEISATADLTFRVGRDEIQELGTELQEIQRRGAILVQPFSPQVLEGEDSLVFFRHASGEAIYSHALIKRPKRGDFRVQEEWGGSIVASDRGEALVDFARFALSKIPGDWLYARVDILHFESRPRLAELELIEPHLYMTWVEGAPGRFAEAISSRL